MINYIAEYDDSVFLYCTCVTILCIIVTVLVVIVSDEVHSDHDVGDVRLLYLLCMRVKLCYIDFDV